MKNESQNLGITCNKSVAKTVLFHKLYFSEYTTDFIKTNLKIRTCIKFKTKSKDICVCNRSRIDHTNSSDTGEEWSYKNNTLLQSCDSYGLINFTGFDFIPRGNCSKFIRFDCVEDCNLTCENVFTLLTEPNLWNIPLPKLIISINGGLKKMKFISNQHKKNFKQGLIDVMKKDNTWVVGNGFNVGIHKLVSETINEFRLQQEDLKDQVTLLGISSWGTVYNNSQLSSTKPANQTTPNRHHVYKYHTSLLTEKGKATLDVLYDYFLFCDDGTEKQYDKETEFRLKFENLVKTKANGFLVQILFEGGRRAITNAFKALSDKVPLVVIKGSGRAANLISEVMELPYKDYEETIRHIVIENKCLLEIPNNRDDKSEIIEYTNYLTGMYRDFRKQIVLYDMMDTSVKFDKKILEAMILGADKSLEKTLQLCIRFNCPNIAERSVFSDSKYANLDHKQIETMFINSLIDNKPEFVDLFLENNFKLENILREELLRDLYRVSFDPVKCQCAELLTDLLDGFGLKKRNGKSEPDLLLRAGCIIQKLSGNILNNRYKDLSTGTPIDHSPDNIELSDIDEMSEQDPDLIEILTVQDLFLWSLLSGRITLSQILWKIGKYHIGSALIAANILQKMASLVLIRGDNNLQRKLIDASMKYQSLAVSILTESYNISKSKTYTLIVRKLSKWNNLTCLDIAINGDMLDFLNHSACRSYTTKVWMGNLSPFLSTWKIIVSIPLGLFLIKPLIMPSFPIHSKTQKISNDVNPDKVLNKQLMPEVKKNKVRSISFVKAINIFYRAPIVKFYIHLFSYIIFLGTFSYMNLVELKPRDEVKHFKNAFAEIFVYIYVLTFTIEECRQVLEQNIHGCIAKVANYLSATWNKLDVFIILIFIAGIVTRFTIYKEHFMICRCLYSITLSMFFLRAMQFYFVNKSIGPKVIMIQDMLRDILFFLSIFVIFIMSYGTLAQALRFPNSKFELILFKDIVYMPYFQTYGELMLDNFEVSAPCNGTDCVIKSTVVVFGFAIFLLLTNVLLINLLIAMFGYTFNQIQDDSEKLWCYIRMQLVQEFYEKPIFPPPLNIFSYVYKMISLPWAARCPKLFFDLEDNMLLKSLDELDNFKISIFEQLSMETALIESLEQKNENTPKTNPERNMNELVEKFSKKTDSSALGPTIESIASFQIRVNAQLDRIQKQIEMIRSNKI